jgi:hypothetical protein
MALPTPEEMSIVTALRLALEMSDSPGFAMNSTSNAFIVHVNGNFDLLKAAQRVAKVLSLGDRFKGETIAE